MDLRKMGREDSRWMEVAQNRVQWLASSLVELSLRILLPVRQFVTLRLMLQVFHCCLFKICDTG
jgi:hypothetical protein